MLRHACTKNRNDDISLQMPTTMMYTSLPTGFNSTADFRDSPCRLFAWCMLDMLDMSGFVRLCISISARMDEFSFSQRNGSCLINHKPLHGKTLCDNNLIGWRNSIRETEYELTKIIRYEFESNQRDAGGLINAGSL